MLLFLFETQELRLGASSTWVAQSATVQNQAITQPSMSLLLASYNRVSSILCSDKITQYGQQLYQHCSALTLLDIHLIVSWWWLAGCWLKTVWGQKGKGRKKYSIFSHGVKPRTLLQHKQPEQDTGHDRPNGLLYKNSKGQVIRKE